MKDYKSRKKITIVINSFNVGGAEMQLARLLNNLDRDRYDIDLITLMNQKKENTIYYKLPKDIDVIKLNFKSFTDLKSWWKLFIILLKIKPEIVMSSLFFSNTVVRVIKPFLGYRVFIREHNTYVHKTKIQIITDKMLSFLSCRIIAVSNGVARFTAIQEKINPKRFIVIPNGIDVNEVKKIIEQLPERDILKSKLGFDNDDKIILNVARLVSQKRHDLLINAFAEFSKTHREYKLVILGDGGLKERLETQIIEIGLKDKVILKGTVKNVFDYYKISEFFISTSDIEGLSNAYLEALSSGLPILSTKTAGTEDILKENVNGFFLKSHEVDEIEKGMEKMITSIFSEDIAGTIKDFDIRNTVQDYSLLFDGGRTVEFIGMQGSGKTTALRYLQKHRERKSILNDSQWLKVWKYYAFIFILKTPVFFFRFFYLSILNSLVIKKPSLIRHKLYILLIRGATWEYLHNRYQFDVRVIDEGFLQLILSIYEKEISHKEMKKLIESIPASNQIIFMKTGYKMNDFTKSSKERKKMGQERFIEWKKVFNNNLNTLVETLEIEKKNIVRINLPNLIKNQDKIIT